MKDDKGFRGGKNNHNGSWNNNGRFPGNRREGNRRDGRRRDGSNRGRNFPKFVDSQKHDKEPDYWHGGRKQWNQHNYFNQNDGGRFGGTLPLYDDNGDAFGAALQHSQNEDAFVGYTGGEKPQMFEDGVNNFQGNSEAPSKVNNEKQISARKDSFSTTSVSTVQQGPAPAVADKPKIVNIKQEKQEMLELKTVKKPATSSSSSSDTSSSEEESENPNVSTGKSITYGQLSKNTNPLADNTNSSSASVTAKTKKPVSDTSSSSSSSSSSEDEEDNQSTKPAPSTNQMSKDSSEEDVVCIGKLENKIILDNDDDEEATAGDKLNKSLKSAKSKTKAKKSDKKSVNKCMICDKKGHTSFECQMICKNCSAPYHGFRKCPQPANLNTMFQLFMEFCMQQFQQFQPDRQFQHLLSNSNPCEGVPQPLVGSPSTIKSGKRKKHLKAKEASKASFSKKRKLSAKKKQTNDEDDDDDSDNTSPDSDETSDSDEESSPEGFVSLNTGKHKKSKGKHKRNRPVPALSLANFMSNHQLNYPLGLSGIPNITAAPSNSQLNTLLLTQMFQNAMNKNHRS